MKPAPFSATAVAIVLSFAINPPASADSSSLTRIATMPEGAEVTGLSTTVLGDILLNAQHPGGKNTFKDDASPALLGYMHGFHSAIWNHPDNHDDDERASFQDGNNNTYIKPKNVNDYLGRMSNPYRYGYLIEINHAASENEQLVKHYATGRLSHETAAIMPDLKTVYMTDDDTAAYSDKKYNNASGGVLFKFLADQKGDLSSGSLYAAKLVQDANADPHEAGFDVSWIKLGSGSNSEIAQWIAEYDSVTTDDYVDGKTSYISDDEIMAYTNGKASDARAAFLESRRTAAAMNATNEWDKLEGITSAGNSVYISASGISYTMDKSWGDKHWSTGAMDTSTGGDIALNAEACGGTYVAQTGSDYNITRIDPYVIGKTTADGRCDENRPANPDNILALDNGTLLIGEDAGPKAHSLDMLWMVK